LSDNVASVERDAAATLEGRSYGGRSPDERRGDRRDRLIESAIALYGSCGFRATPITEICRKAKVTQRHFYELFSSSDELLLAAYDAVIAEQHASITAALEAAPEDSQARVHSGVSAAVSLWEDDRRARLIQQEILGVSDEVDRRYTAVMQEFADLIAAQAVELGIEGWSPERLNLVSRLLAGGLNEVLFAWRMSPAGERRPLQTVAREIGDVFLAALETNAR
jgi:AcrR family transcriptional regulator